MHRFLGAKGVDNACWHKYWNGTWNGWNSLGGTFTSEFACVSYGLATSMCLDGARTTTTIRSGTIHPKAVGGIGWN